MSDIPREIIELTTLIAEKPELLKDLHIHQSRLVRLAEHLISNGITVQKWIPVSERLPTEEDADAKGRVYAISEGAYPRMWQWSMVVMYPECFTHWYKLPEPPKECE